MLPVPALGEGGMLHVFQQLSGAVCLPVQFGVDLQWSLYHLLSAEEVNHYSMNGDGMQRQVFETCSGLCGIVHMHTYFVLF